MEIKSPVFENNGMIPAKYTCDGENINPPLEILGIPEGAKSLALVIDDPDASTGMWDHWTVWNINPQENLIKENLVPAGAVEGMNDFQKTRYGGPCPHQGKHRYFFKIYALDRILNLSSSARKKDLEKAMECHILDSAQITGLYQRA